MFIALQCLTFRLSHGLRYEVSDIGMDPSVRLVKALTLGLGHVASDYRYGVSDLSKLQLEDLGTLQTWTRI